MFHVEHRPITGPGTQQTINPKENTRPTTGLPFPASGPGLFSAYPYSPTNEANRGK